MRPITFVLFIAMTIGYFESARAQFLGDVFFETPSILAESGETAVLSVAAFTGVETFGSIDFLVSFESSALSFESIEFPEGMTGEVLVETNDDLIQLRVIVANIASLQRPAGIVSVAEISVSVLAINGESISISSENRNLFLANYEEITNSGLGAEIVVESRGATAFKSPIPVSTSAKVELVEARTGTKLYERIMKVRNNNSPVLLAEPDGTFTMADE